MLRCLLVQSTTYCSQILCWHYYHHLHRALNDLSINSSESIRESKNRCQYWTFAMPPWADDSLWSPSVQYSTMSLFMKCIPSNCSRITAKVKTMMMSKKCQQIFRRRRQCSIQRDFGIDHSKQERRKHVYFTYIYILYVNTVISSLLRIQIALYRRIHVRKKSYCLFLVAMATLASST